MQFMKTVRYMKTSFERLD